MSEAAIHPEMRRHEPLPVPRRALTVGAHPDDAEFGAGGTIALWAAQGCEVSMLVLTDGSKGTWDPDTDPAELVEQRRAEQRKAAEVLGVTGELVFCDHPDGELEAGMQLRELVCYWVRRLRPDVVLGFDPWRRYMIHPDHRAAGWATVDGVVAARDHLFFPDQGLDKHRPEALLLWFPDQADHWVDIGRTFDTKIEALLCHSSQSRTTMGNAAEDPAAREEFRRRVREHNARMGAEAGLAVAEAFKLIRP
ncbi:MAG: GlcNAc-PI de-N-acetylase [Acidimicrobiia bacterium]|nr:MAG: GlcNAc-PI de-N-acetylase [Acidimicrobiia bacterium]